MSFLKIINKFQSRNLEKRIKSCENNYIEYYAGSEMDIS